MNWSTVQWNQRMRNTLKARPCVSSTSDVLSLKRPALISRIMWSSNIVILSYTSALHRHATALPVAQGECWLAQYYAARSYGAHDMSQMADTSNCMVTTTAIVSFVHAWHLLLAMGMAFLINQNSCAACLINCGKWHWHAWLQTEVCWLTPLTAIAALQQSLAQSMLAICRRHYCLNINTTPNPNNPIYRHYWCIHLALSYARLCPTWAQPSRLKLQIQIC